MGDILSMFITRNGIHFFETCRYIIPNIVFSCFFKKLDYSCSIVLYVILSGQERSKSRFWFGRRILVAFQHHQLLPFNSKLAEPERFKETRRFNIVFTDHFVLFTAKDSDTWEQVYWLVDSHCLKYCSRHSVHLEQMYRYWITSSVKLWQHLIWTSATMTE